MSQSQEKLRRLAHVARRYYLEYWKQSDIARELGVSRPLISRMLGEARELGVVQITICEPGEKKDRLQNELRRFNTLRDSILVENGTDVEETNRRISEGALELLYRIGTRRVGVGWGGS